jgi:hypothetical protein
MQVAKSKINIEILEACRNNPFERSWTIYDEAPKFFGPLVVLDYGIGDQIIRLS